MRINFVLPTLSMAGGIKVVAIYARLLAERGHNVCVVSPPTRPPTLRERVRTLRQGVGWQQPGGASPSHFDGLAVEQRVLERWRPVIDRDLPDADVVVATWWETAEWVYALSARKGAKAYFIQGHEVFPGLPVDRVRATYRLPLHKITISRWLVELMRGEYGDAVVDHVPNAVDHSVYYAPPRDRQTRPTIGMLYSRSPFKGCDVAVAAVEKLRRQLPELRLLSFGAERPYAAMPLPAYAEFIRYPSPDALRALYASCDVWLCGSRTEGFHLPPVEAMACRTPVVSTRVGGPLDLIESGVNGELVDIEDVDGLSEAALRLLSLPADAWQSLSERAYHTVAGYTWDQAATGFLVALQNARARTFSECHTPNRQSAAR